MSAPPPSFHAHPIPGPGWSRAAQPFHHLNEHQRDQLHFIPVCARGGVVAISAPILGNSAFQALSFQLGQGTRQGWSPALLGPVRCPTGASPGRKDLTLILSCFVLEGIPHSAFLGLLCSLLLKFASPLKVSCAHVSTLRAAKCLFGKSGEWEQPQRGRRWEPYTAGTEPIEPLGCKKPTKCAAFFFF